MTAPYNPPTRGEDFKIDIALEDMAASGVLRLNPTISAGDFQVRKDRGSWNNLTTLPTGGASHPAVALDVSATMTADIVTIWGHDQTNPPEWADFWLSIPTTT